SAIGCASPPFSQAYLAKAPHKSTIVEPRSAPVRRPGPKTTIFMAFLLSADARPRYPGDVASFRREQAVLRARLRSLRLDQGGHQAAELIERIVGRRPEHRRI